jgi:multiple sugar transport system ATP-binding protein
MTVLTLNNLRKAYSKTVVPVQTMSLTVQSGEFLTLLGPSGCGKSTILRLIAGLESPTAGQILLDDRDITALAPGDRDMAMVFQSYALYPHMSVFDNIASGLKLRQVASHEIKQRVYPVAQFLGLADLMDRKPGQLSGGQRQRVAVARALVRQPAVFLLDEPLSNLDALLREQVRSELKQLFANQTTPIVYVTHDQTEAMSLSSRVAVLYNGELQQLDTPAQIYQHPANRFVAGFIGSPQMNFLHLSVDDRQVMVGNTKIALPDRIANCPQITFGIRPEAIVIDPDSHLVGSITIVENLGMHQLITIGLPTANHAESISLRLLASPAAGYTIGDRLAITLPSAQLHWFDTVTQLAL